jgi:hypothetical protein
VSVSPPLVSPPEVSVLVSVVVVLPVLPVLPDFLLLLDEAVIEPEGIVSGGFSRLVGVVSTGSPPQPERATASATAAIAAMGRKL